MIIFAVRACKAFDRRQITKLYTNSDDFALTVRYRSLHVLSFWAVLSLKKYRPEGQSVSETLSVKLFDSLKCTAFVCNWPLYCPLQFQWNKASFDKRF